MPALRTNPAIAAADLMVGRHDLVPVRMRNFGGSDEIFLDGPALQSLRSGGTV
jgi:hypothetical protein